LVYVVASFRFHPHPAESVPHIELPYIDACELLDQWKSTSSTQASQVAVVALERLLRKEEVTMDIAVEKDVYDQIRLLGKGMTLTESEVVTYLLEEFKRDLNETTPEAAGSVEVFSIYDGCRITGSFDTKTSALTITSGPLTGQRFRSPSGAAVAHVHAVKPQIDPNRNGWSFWIVGSTGRPLQSPRHR